MIKKLAILSLAVALTSGLVTPLQVEAQATTTASSSVSEIQRLLEQIKTLQTQIESLRQQQSSLQLQVRQNMELARSLRTGMSGEDVKVLQELLAADPTIYPEKLITGFFGPATERAVKKFQEKNGLESVGNVGPQTLSRLNELLSQGAGKSGKIPPGLLIAPGIQKKLGSSTPIQIPLGQKLPPGIAKKLGPSASTTDTTAPVVSNLSVSNLASTSATVSWNTNEVATSMLWLGTISPLSISGISTASSSNLSTTHSFSFSNLTASTTHYYIVRSVDKSGNVSTVTEQSFNTLAQ